MNTQLHIPAADNGTTVHDIVDALTVLAYSVRIIAEALERRGMDTDEAEDDAFTRTTAYFNTTADVVRAAVRSLFHKQPCDLHTFAFECHRRGTPEVLALGREWLEHHRGRTNRLVRPFVH